MSYRLRRMDGGCGFIGSNFIRHALREQLAARITNLDKLTYAGRLESARAILPATSAIVL